MSWKPPSSTAAGPSPLAHSPLASGARGSKRSAAARAIARRIARTHACPCAVKGSMSMVTPTLVALRAALQYCPTTASSASATYAARAG